MDRAYFEARKVELEAEMAKRKSDLEGVQAAITQARQHEHNLVQSLNATGGALQEVLKALESVGEPNVTQLRAVRKAK